jgi:hypothetical protein
VNFEEKEYAKERERKWLWNLLAVTITMAIFFWSAEYVKIVNDFHRLVNWGVKKKSVIQSYASDIDSGFGEAR